MTLCNLFGVLTDSTGTPLTGKLVITLSAEMIDDVVVSNTLALPVPKTYIVTNGVVNINVPSSEARYSSSGELQRNATSYLFEFYLAKLPLTTPIVYEDFPFRSFNATVPEATSYAFAKLTPVSITTDNLSTGALRVAKALSGDPAAFNLFIAALETYRQKALDGTLALSTEAQIKSVEGVVFSRPKVIAPATPARFKSAPMFARDYIVGRTAALATSDYERAIPFDTLFDYQDLVINYVNYRFSVTGTNNSTNYWKISAGTKLIGVSTYDLQAPLLSYSAAANSTPIFTSPTRNVTTLEYFILKVEKIGTPGTLNLQTSFCYSYLQPV